MDNPLPQSITKPLDHDPFGMITFGRSWEAGSGYRYRFNGQEQDDEVYGKGNLNSAEFWQYDSRLARRWNLDPVINFSQSGFSVFNDNPLFFFDVNGDNGEVSINKDNKTVDVKLTFYYDASNPQTSQIVETYKSLTENSWTMNDYTVVDDQGEIWHVNYEVVYIGLTSEDEVNKKLESEDGLYANKFSTDLPIAGFGDARYSNREYSVVPAYERYNRTVSEHEYGHAMGLEHAKYIETSGIPYNQNFFTPAIATPESNPYFEDNLNGYGQDVLGPIMSYANNREIQPYEVRLTVIDAINLAKQTEGKIIIIHIKGHTESNRNPEIIDIK